MKLRRLTDGGMEQFRTYLHQLRAQLTLTPPRLLLTDDAASEPLPVDVELEDQQFASRLAAAKYLDAVISASGLTQVERDAGLWSWLALFYFDQICPPKKNGARSAGEDARYILATGKSLRFYRQMLYGPWAAYQLHKDNPDRLLALLCGPVHVATSEVFRLFIENQSLLACPAAVATATTLYYDFERHKLKTGAGSRDKNSGECRRLIEVLQQLDCTYDLPLLTEERLLSLLPAEFKRFVPKQLRLLG